MLISRLAGWREHLDGREGVFFQLLAQRAESSGPEFENLHQNPPGRGAGLVTGAIAAPPAEFLILQVWDGCENLHF